MSEFLALRNAAPATRTIVDPTIARTGADNSVTADGSSGIAVATPGTSASPTITAHVRAITPNPMHLGIGWDREYLSTDVAVGSVSILGAVPAAGARLIVPVPLAANVSYWPPI